MRKKLADNGGPPKPLLLKCHPITSSGHCKYPRSMSCKLTKFGRLSSNSPTNLTMPQHCWRIVSRRLSCMISIECDPVWNCYTFVWHTRAEPSWPDMVNLNSFGPIYVSTLLGPNLILIISCNARTALQPRKFQLHCTAWGWHKSHPIQSLPKVSQTGPYYTLRFPTKRPTFFSSPPATPLSIFIFISNFAAMLEPKLPPRSNF